MKLKEQFFLLTRGKQIAVVVIAIHLLAIFGSFGHHLFTRRWKPPRAIVVKTMTERRGSVERKTATAERKELAEKPVAAALKAKKEVAQQPVATAPKVKKEVAKPKGEKKVATTPKPTAKKGGAVKGDPILKEMVESFKSFETEVKSRPALSVPAKIEAKETSVAERVEDPTYSEFLISYLQRELDLPEFGEVRIKMEIDRFGKLIDCEILEAKSKKNGEFLKEQLPGLSFPNLAEFGIIDATHTFTITFRNL